MSGSRRKRFFLKRTVRFSSYYWMQYNCIITRDYMKRLLALIFFPTRKSDESWSHETYDQDHGVKNLAKSLTAVLHGPIHVQNSIMHPNQSLNLQASAKWQDPRPWHLWLNRSSPYFRAVNLECQFIPGTNCGVQLPFLNLTLSGPSFAPFQLCQGSLFDGFRDSLVGM